MVPQLIKIPPAMPPPPELSIVIPTHDTRDLTLRCLETVFASPPPSGEPEVVLVDDASRDGTADKLAELAGTLPKRVRFVALDRNMGKGEAVRRGVLEALRASPAYVGYWDADLATPLAALAPLRQALEADPARCLVMGSRIQRLGSAIRRSPLRHYAGRVMATFASRTLNLPVYDTQCGAKLFRVAPLFPRLFEKPFLSRWLFDVEILARIEAAAAEGLVKRALESVWEEPLLLWTDEPGSKVKAWDFVRALRDLRRIRKAYPVLRRTS